MTKEGLQRRIRQIKRAIARNELDQEAHRILRTELATAEKALDDYLRRPK